MQDVRRCPCSTDYLQHPQDLRLSRSEPTPWRGCRSAASEQSAGGIADTRGEHDDSPLATLPISVTGSSIDSLRRWYPATPASAHATMRASSSSDIENDHPDVRTYLKGGLHQYRTVTGVQIDEDQTRRFHVESRDQRRQIPRHFGCRGTVGGDRRGQALPLKWNRRRSAASDRRADTGRRGFSGRGCARHGVLVVPTGSAVQRGAGR